ncbi:hypothetical protein HYV85_01350 [Candidatus Woesearchaeota archaeon]|nr:hypothetical protein [Candidatus Woesearchaeota archaeon]
MNFNRLNKKQLLLLLVFSLVLVQVASAANIFEQAFEPFKGLSPDFYDNNWWWLDLLAYAFFFISIGQFALKGKMGDEKGRLGIVVGSILAGSLIVYELRTGARLANLAPLALFLLSFVLGALVYNFAKGMGADKVPAFSFGFLTTYTFISMHGSEVMKSLEVMAQNNSGASLLLSVFKIGLPIAAIGLIYSIVKGIKHMFSGGFMGNMKGEQDLLEKGKETAAEQFHKKFGRVEEAEAGQIANVEQYETRLDEFAKRLGKGEIKDEQQFRDELQKAIKLAEEAEKVEMELETIMQQVQAGQYSEKTRGQVDDLRKKYSEHVNSVFKRVQAADRFARDERQQLLTEIKDTLAALQTNNRVEKIGGDLTFLLSNDINRFINDHKAGLNAQAESDIRELKKVAEEFKQLESDKKAMLLSVEQQLKALEGATNTEINDLGNIMAEMRSLAKMGQLRRPQLNSIVQQLNSLLQMGSAKQHGIPPVQDLLKRIRNVDDRIKKAAIMYKRLENVLMNLTVKKRGLGSRLTQTSADLRKNLRI